MASVLRASLLGSDVVGAAEQALHELLQRTFRIQRDGVVLQCLELGDQRPAHQQARRLQPLVDHHRADHGFKCALEVPLPLATARGLLAAPEQQCLAQPELARHPREGGAAHQLGAPLGELAFLQRRELGVERSRHDQAEHRIAEEFEPLVGPGIVVRVLVGVRGVGERGAQQAGVAKLDAQLALQRAQHLVDGRPLLVAMLAGGSGVGRARRRGRHCHARTTTGGREACGHATSDAVVESTSAFPHPRR